MRTCILANGPTPKKTHTKLDRNIEKKERQKCSNVCFSPTRSKKSQPNPAQVDCEANEKNPTI